MSRYEQAIARLVTARRFGVVLGLDRMRVLLDALGFPDARLGRVIHVGGTNGKGSTVAMIASMLRAAGRRVGVYTSPHLNELRERIVIDGVPIAYDDFARYADRVVEAGGGELTFFEQVTAIALCAFADAALDVTILEVGLGGRLDATNAVRSDVAVATGVAMDHEAILGNTLELIAHEKAGIFKPGARVVIGAAGEPAAVPVLVADARAVGIEPIVVTAPTTLNVALPGNHQRVNAATALAALDAVAAAGGPTVSEEARATGLATVVHPGRFEILENRTLAPRAGMPLTLARVILDGAHNPHGARHLAQTLRAGRLATETSSDKPALIIGVSADKDVRALVGALLDDVSVVVATRAKNDRAMPPLELATLVRELVAERGLAVRVREAGTLTGAFYSLDDSPVPAHAGASIATTVVVAGSLFLVGEARELLLGVRSDPANVTDPAAVHR
ncbi:MAG TPA: Mur ligase family protein [Kofleriaceae bacterium]|jgi:dihydrofolate synthase/folylpolyglutamate synthase